MCLLWVVYQNVKNIIINEELSLYDNQREGLFDI